MLEVGEQQQQQQGQQGKACPQSAAVAAGGQACSAQQGSKGSSATRELQAALRTAQKRVNVVDTLDTCENIRVVLIDNVPVPCDLVTLVRGLQSIEAQLEQVQPGQSGPSTVAAAMLDWMVRTGLAFLADNTADVNATTPAPRVTFSERSGLTNTTAPVQTKNAAVRPGMPAWGVVAAALAAAGAAGVLA